MTKVIFIIIFVVLISLKTGGELPICNFKTATQALAPRIFAEQTVDGHDQPVLVTRFLHNKVGIFANEFSRCYFNVLDPNFVYHSVGLIGIIFWLYFSYQIIVKKRWLMLSMFLVVPVLPFLRFPPQIVVYWHKLFAIIGLVFAVLGKR